MTYPTAPTCASAREDDSEELSEREVKFRTALEEHYAAAGKKRGDGPVHSRFATWAAGVRAVWMRSHGGKTGEA